jgi:two-component system NtrC family sensor kinase
VRKIEDILLILRSEIKKSSGAGEPFLACDTGQFGPWILYFKRGEVAELKTKSYWKFGPTLRINDPEDQLYLANSFSRPFSRVIAFPLGSKGGQSRHLTLFVEHQLATTDVESFIESMGERLQSLTLAIDRSLFEIDLKRASFLWESTFDSIDDPIAIFSDQGEVIRCNDAYSELQDGKEFVDNSEVPEGSVVAILQRCLQSQQIVTQSVRLGNQFFDCNCYPIAFSQNEKPTSAVVHLVDVTNYKHLQSVMMQNEKMSAIGHLAGNIAHELNNPLTGIRSLCQVLFSQDEIEDTLAQDIREVESAAGRSQKIINNLLNFSRFDESNSVVKSSLRELVQSTLPLLKSILSDHLRNIELDEVDDFVLVEPHLTQQVIFNLIANACQAMESSGEITIRTYRQDERVYFSVKDSGPGVVEALSNSIFEPFVTSKSGQGGTGLGLSMSRKVIERFGGQICFSSKPGLGATFWFWLPRIQEKGDE